MVIQCVFKECRPYLNELETRFGLAQWAEQSNGFSLHYDDSGLSLYKTDEPKLGAINVDFVTVQRHIDVSLVGERPSNCKSGWLKQRGNARCA